jgi:glycosyltransferase involved in cell wall biosynthesis
MKKRLSVFNTQPPHLYFGGVERRIIETSKRLQNNFEITVYSGTKNGFENTVSVDGAKIVPCYSTDRAFPIDNWYFNRTLKKMFSTIQADVYEAHAVSGYNFLKTLRKRKIKTPFIQTVHGVLADEYLQATMIGGLTFREKIANFFMWQLARIERYASRNADLVVTVSDYSAEKIVQLYGVNKGTIRVAPNGVDPETFKPADGEAFKRKYGLENKQVVLFVGRLVPRKGLWFLVNAALEVLKEKKETVFAIVGDGPLKNKMVSQLEKFELSQNFKFFSKISDEELPNLYSCADVFVLPSIQEGQGIVLLEAQAAAKPVVAFNVGAVKEAMIDGESGFLVDKGKTEQFSEYILKLLSDDSLRTHMGASGRRFVLDNFTWDICAEKMQKIYNEALALG